MRKDLRDKLGKEWLFCDGGTGSYLQKKGLKGGELPERWNIERPDVITGLYESYLNAGSDIINANTFGANILKYPDDLKEVVTAGVKLADEARKNTGRDDAYITIDIGPTGKLMEPYGDLSFDRAVEVFGTTIRFGVEAGADLVLIETMSDGYEAKAAVIAAKENCSLPVIVTMVFDEKGKLLTGGDVAGTVAMLEGLGVDALGLNCSLGPDLMAPVLKEINKYASVPIVVNPNAGLPRTENGQTVYDLAPGDFADSMEKLADIGLQVAGGCCGTTAEHIKETIKRLKGREFIPNKRKDQTIVSSFGGAAIIGDKPVIIGERINPTGKKRFKEALRTNDIDYIISQGLEQEDAGAEILDVNVGLPEIDEPAMMKTVVTKLQGVTGLPLQIDTSDPEALEAGLRYYNGKAMINSVNGKMESIEQVMPIVAKYGGVLVGLALDEDGIPEDADGRIRIAEKIYKAAREYGIDKKDIVIDGLCMAVSSEPGAGKAALETVRRVREEMGGKTILGVSNISFGLPARQIINSNFLVMAMTMGLNLAIMNPNNSRMMSAYKAYLALAGYDRNCMDYIESYKDAAIPAVSVKGAAAKDAAAKDTAATGERKDSARADNKESMLLSEMIERGLVSAAADKMREEMKDREALDIINEELIPALDKVGQGFEKGTLFLPQLLMSADAAKAAFEVAKETLSESSGESKGKVIVASVKGDIHDIGKNIVKVMLENYGYDVIDLGKDVAPETIVERAEKENVKAVGLSALMTTTVVSMEDTIKLMKERCPETKVIVGGAVMTPEYAETIGADVYAKDAMATVRACDAIFDS